jgi:hypothetical protein
MGAKAAAVQSDDMPAYIVGGFLCIFNGKNSFTGDECSSFYPRILVLALIYVAVSTIVAGSMTLYIHVFHVADDSSHHPTFISATNASPQPTDPADRVTQAVIASTAIALLFSYIPGIRSAAGESSNYSWKIAACGVLAIFGLVIAGQVVPPSPSDENLEDLWEAMEQDERPVP